MLLVAEACRDNIRFRFETELLDAHFLSEKTARCPGKPGLLLAWSAC